MVRREEFPLTGLPLARLRARPLRARFRERPNRFQARVQLPESEEVIAHLGDPGRLTGTLRPGRTVLLDGPYPPPRKCRYSLVGVQCGRTLVCTVPVMANRLFAELWKRGAFPELPNGEISAEVTHGRSRIDFRVRDTFVEVKSITLVSDGVGLFPDAVTARGAKHCRELGELAAQGAPAAIVLIAQRADIETISPADDIDPEFCAALRQAAAAGVQVLGCTVKFLAHGAERAWRVPVIL